MYQLHYPRPQKEVTTSLPFLYIPTQPGPISWPLTFYGNPLCLGTLSSHCKSQLREATIVANANTSHNEAAKTHRKKEGKGASLVWWPLICVWRGVVFCLVRVVGYSSNWSNKAKKGVVTVVGCDTLEWWTRNEYSIITSKLIRDSGTPFTIRTNTTNMS